LRWVKQQLLDAAEANRPRNRPPHGFCRVLNDAPTEKLGLWVAIGMCLA